MSAITFNPNELLKLVDELDSTNFKILERYQTKYNLSDDWLEKASEPETISRLQKIKDAILGKKIPAHVQNEYNYVIEAGEYLRASDLLDELRTACEFANKFNEKVLVKTKDFIKLMRWKKEWEVVSESA